MAITVKLKSAPLKGIDSRPVVKSMQRALYNVLIDHFDKKNAQGNSKGWWRSNFWNNEVGNNTHMGKATATSAEVIVTSAPYRHKITGGKILPKEAKALAIPNTSEAKKLVSPGLVMGKPQFKYVPLKTTTNLVGLITFDAKAKKKKESKKPLESMLSKHDKLSKMRRFLGSESYQAKFAANSKIKKRKKISGTKYGARLKKHLASIKKNMLPVYWWLLKEVNQDPDPTAEPTSEAINTAVSAAMKDAIGRQLKKL